MGQTNINIRIDENLKRQFEEFCNEMGMSMTTAFNTYAKKVVRENRIPFEISRETPNSVTKQAIKDAEEGIGLSQAFSSVNEVMEYLNAED